MAFDFKPAVRKDLHTMVMIGGMSSSGKTYSAMRLAKGLAGDKRFAVIDTEASRALHYAKDANGVGFDFDHMDFSPYDEKGNLLGFTPERYADAIEAADRAGYPVIVVDSFSHVWEGVGGVLEMQEAEMHRRADGDVAKMERVRGASWIMPKAQHRKMFQRFMQLRAHLILCVRAKEVADFLMKDARRKSKIRRSDLGYDFACDKDAIFEMTSVLLLESGSRGAPTHIKVSDEHLMCFPEGRQITEESGRMLARWAAGENMDEARRKLLEAARNAAADGKEAFKTWWAKVPREDRAAVQPIMDELAEKARKADERAATSDPFAEDEPAGPSRLAEILDALKPAKTVAHIDAILAMHEEAVEALSDEDRATLDGQVRALRGVMEDA